MDPARRRRLSFAILGGGALVAVLFATKAPHEQHVRLALGDAAPGVTLVEIAYVTEGGEPSRETRLAYEPGKAPRVVALDPQLPDGPYLLRIDVGTREGRKSVERQVTLSGGTTQVDLSTALLRTP